MLRQTLILSPSRDVPKLQSLLMAGAGGDDVPHMFHHIATLGAAVWQLILDLWAEK